MHRSVHYREQGYNSGQLRTEPAHTTASYTQYSLHHMSISYIMFDYFMVETLSYVRWLSKCIIYNVYKNVEYSIQICEYIDHVCHIICASQIGNIGRSLCNACMIGAVTKHCKKSLSQNAPIFANANAITRITN